MTVLPRRLLGPTGLQITPLGFGCAEIGDMAETFAYSVPEDRALATVRAAFASPITFLDTAASYGDGESERRIGLVLRERQSGLPSGYVLSTKADRDLVTGDFSGDQIKRSVERSLRLLGLNCLQLVFLHDPEHTTFDAAMAPSGPVEVLHRFKAEGVIEHVGVAGGPIELMMRYVETGAFEAVISHNRYTLLNRSAEPLLAMASRHAVGVLNAAPYGSGILAKGPQAYPRYAYTPASSDMLNRATAIAEICRRYGVPLAAAALQFSLRDQRIVSTIVGMSRPERLQQTLELAAVPIPEEVWAELDTQVGPLDDPESVRWRRG
ncbi:MAG: aldo/keto reductase [Chloroflexota bacterium]